MLNDSSIRESILSLCRNSDPITKMAGIGLAVAYDNQEMEKIAEIMESPTRLFGFGTGMLKRAQREVYEGAWKKHWWNPVTWFSTQQDLNLEAALEAAKKKHGYGLTAKDLESGVARKIQEREQAQALENQLVEAQRKGVQQSISQLPGGSTYRPPTPQYGPYSPRGYIPRYVPRYVPRRGGWPYYSYRPYYGWI